MSHYYENRPDEFLARHPFGKICIDTSVKGGSNFRWLPLMPQQNNTNKRILVLDGNNLVDQLVRVIAAFDYQQAETRGWEVFRSDFVQTCL